MPPPRQFMNSQWIYGGSARLHIKKTAVGMILLKVPTQKSTEEAISNVISKLQESFTKIKIKRVKFRSRPLTREACFYSYLSYIGRGSFSKSS